MYHEKTWQDMYDLVKDAKIPFINKTPSYQNFQSQCINYFSHLKYETQPELEIKPQN